MKTLTFNKMVPDPSYPFKKNGRGELKHFPWCQEKHFHMKCGEKKILPPPPPPPPTKKIVLCYPLHDYLLRLGVGN